MEFTVIRADGKRRDLISTCAVVGILGVEVILDASSWGWEGLGEDCRVTSSGLLGCTNEILNEDGSASKMNVNEAEKAL